MLTITPDAVEAIKGTLGVRGGGLRVSVATHASNGHGPALNVELALDPAPSDVLIEVDGASLFLDPDAAELLDGKLLDASRDGDAIHFSLHDGR